MKSHSDPNISAFDTAALLRVEIGTCSLVVGSKSTRSVRVISETEEGTEQAGAKHKAPGLVCAAFKAPVLVFLGWHTAHRSLGAYAQTTFRTGTTRTSI